MFKNKLARISKILYYLSEIGIATERFPCTDVEFKNLRWFRNSAPVSAASSDSANVHQQQQQNQIDSIIYIANMYDNENPCLYSDPSPLSNTQWAAHEPDTAITPLLRHTVGPGMPSLFKLLIDQQFGVTESSLLS